MSFVTAGAWRCRTDGGGDHQDPQPLPGLQPGRELTQPGTGAAECRRGRWRWCRWCTAAVPRRGGAPVAAAAQLKDLAKDLPKPIAAMLQTVSDSSSAVTSSGASQQISDAWKSKVLPLCTEAFNRYPFIPGSASDVPSDDFARLLGPKRVDRHVLQRKPEDPRRHQPKPLEVAGGGQCEARPAAGDADTIREGRANSRLAVYQRQRQMQVKFQLVPVATLIQASARSALDFGGQTLDLQSRANRTHDHPMAGEWGQDADPRHR